MSDEEVKVDEIKAEEQDLSKLQMDRCVPIAREILKMVADNEELKTGIGSRENLIGSYDGITKAILGVMLRENIEVKDYELILQLILQPIDLTIGAVKHAFQLNFSNMLEKKFGKPVPELTFAEMDELLKS